MAEVNPLASTIQNNVSNTGANKSALGSLADDFDSFLQLLVAQLENQDPTSPADPNKFTDQLVAFTEVEQTIATNTNLERLIETTTASQTGSIVSFVGKNVLMNSDKIALEETGDVPIRYELSGDAKRTFVSIKDSNGKTVYSGDGLATQGTNELVWNGLDQQTNERLPAGNYTVKVTVEDGNGVLDEVPTQVTGHVDGVNLEDGGITLAVNGGFTSLDKVSFVGE